MIQINSENVIRYLTMGIVVVTALPIHELAHGWVADKLGDPTARKSGRLTMNPFAHLDLFGTLALVVFGFGWAKPIPIDSRNFKNPKRDMALSALAGPASNIAIAFLLTVIFKIYTFFGGMNTDAGFMVGQILYTILITNITLAVFNLLPVPPLDGAKILEAILPLSVRVKMYRYEKYFYVTLILLLFLGILQIPLNFLANLIWTALNWMTAFVDLLLQFVG